jgi:TolC family type I secretion outer membrane protein
MLFKKLLAFGLMISLFSPTLSFSQTNESVPLTLEQCVQIALQQNSSFLNAQRQARIAETQVTTARSGILPIISASLSSGRFRQGTSTFKRDVPIVDPQTGQTVGFQQLEVIQSGSVRQSHSASFTLSQTFFDFGGTYNNIRQAKANRESAYFSVDNSRQNTILTVHQRYYELLKNIRLSEVFTEAVKSSEEQLKRTQSMYEIGSVAQVEVFRTQTTLGNDRINLIRQENLVRDSRALLNVAMGRQPDASLEIVDFEEVGLPRNYVEEEVIHVAMQNNPQIFQFKSDMRASTYGARVAKTAFLPSISGFAQYSRNNSEFDRVYSEFNKNFSVNLGIRIDWNLFNGFADAANVERQANNYRIAEENLVSTQRELRRQVREALLDLQVNREVSRINEENLKSSQEDLRLARERYRVGAGTLLDVITAQVNLTRARATFVQAKYDTKITEARLQAAMGTLK